MVLGGIGEGGRDRGEEEGEKEGEVRGRGGGEREEMEESQ